MIKVINNYSGEEFYFQFYASEQFPGCFWYTKVKESVGFTLARINDYTPMNITWEDIRHEEPNI